MRGEVKLQLIRLGHPVQDMAGYKPGDPLPFELSPITKQNGKPFGLRHYQQAAVDVFHAGGGPDGGAGVLVLPCGAGKTVIGIGCMGTLQTHTLVLTTNGTAVKQWKQELLDKTTLTEDQVGLYTGDTKEIKPVTIATYQILTYRKSKTGPLRALQALRGRQLGPGDLRRSAHAAGPGVPGGGGTPGQAAPGPHGHPGARGRQGRGRLQPHRPQARGRALEDAGEGRLHRHGPLPGDPRPPAHGRAHGIRRGRPAPALPHRLREQPEDGRDGRAAGGPSRRTTSSSSASTSSSSASSASGWGRRCSRGRRPRRNGRASSASSAKASSGCSS